MNISRRILFTLMLLLSGCSLFKKAEFKPETLPPVIVEEEVLTEEQEVQEVQEVEKAAPLILQKALKKTAAINPQQKKCIDTLACVKYPKELRAIPNEFSIGVFDEAFGGNAAKVIDDEFKAGRSHIRVNLLWSDSHSYGDGNIKYITKRSKVYNKICLKYPGQTLQIAPFTEHNIPANKIDKYLSIVKANAPNCGKPVNSVWNGGFTKNPAFENEVHGTKKDPKIPGVSYSYSYDGSNSVDSNVTQKLEDHSKASRFCMWHPRLNLRYRMKDPAPRSQRIKEAKDRKPSKDLLESLVYLFSGRGNVSLPPKWLQKSHADKHDKNDLKGDKLLFITPIKKLNKKGKVQPVVLKYNETGKKAGTCNYYGPFEDGRSRYYCPVMGYKYGPDLGVYISGTKYGNANGGFRLGDYREEG